MANDTPVSKKYRVLKNEASDTWDRVSFWTKASDVYFNDDVSAKDLKPTNTLLRNTFYSIGDVVFEKTARTRYLFVCIVSGITDTDTPIEYARALPGDLVIDGTAQFRMYNYKPSSTSTDLYNTSSLRAVDNVKSRLIADDNVEFYFGKENDIYGFFTSEARTNATFHPFQHGYTRYSPFNSSTTPTKSFSINAGQSKTIPLYAPTGYAWKEIWLIQLLGNSSDHPFYVYHYFYDLHSSTYFWGWENGISSEELIITSLDNEGGSVVFKNNDSVTRTITPYYIWGYLENA